MKDLIIVGAGPGGLSSAIYGIRAGLDLLVVEKFSPGGQVVNTFEVENYPGFVDPVPGWELVSAMENQAKRLGAEIASGEVEAVKKEGDAFNIVLAGGNVMQSKSVIVATGAAMKKLGIPGEGEFTGRGVSYCATCDGAFFKGKAVAVVGGGNTALEEAVFLTRFASRVYLIHRRDQFRGAKILQERVLSNEMIEPIYDTIPTAIDGEQKVEAVALKNKKTEDERELKIDGVFIFVGYTPNTGFLPGDVLNESGQVIVDINMKTSTEGLFAAGDLRQDSIRQIVSAAADGATASLGAYDYITNL